jgi:hypothetical protein
VIALATSSGELHPSVIEGVPFLLFELIQPGAPVQHGVPIASRSRLC